MDHPWTRPPVPGEGDDGRDGTEPPDGPDPDLSFALRSMDPPAHRPGFWEAVDARVEAEGGQADAPAGGAAAPPPPPPVTEVAPLAAVPPPSRRPPRGVVWALAAAVLALVLAAAALLVSDPDTELDTTSAATEPTALPSTTATTVAATTTVPVPTTRLAVTPTTVARSTTSAANPDPFVLVPKGLGALRFGMTGAQAKATGVVGAMTADELAPDGSCGFAKPAGTYRDSDFGALFLEGKLARLYVAEGSRLRTPQGIASRSPESKLSSVPGTRYELPHPYQEEAKNVYVMSGDLGYQFTVVGGLVTEWSAGTKDGLDTPEGCA
jgi:hypothetical protein